MEQGYILDHASRLSRYRGLLVASNIGEGDGPAVDLPASAIVLRQRSLGRPRDFAFRLLGSSPSLVAVLRASDVALIHAHFGPDGARMLSASRALGVPLVTTYHGFDATRQDSALRHGPWGERFYLRRRSDLANQGALHIAVSEFIRGRLLSLGFPADRTITHYLGIDTDFFSPEPARLVGDRVVFVGRLDEEKGCLDLVLAMREVCTIHPRASVVFVGDGPIRARIVALAEECRVRCEVTGIESPEGVRRWLRTGALFCGPSVTAATGWQEGFGLTFAEAQACGLPVVAYRSGGTPEAVEHGVTGLLAREGDVMGLASHLVTLLSDVEVRKRMSAAAFRRPRALFDRARQTRDLETIYDALLQESAMAGSRR